MCCWFHVYYSEQDKKHISPSRVETPQTPTLSGAKQGGSRTLGRPLSFQFQAGTSNLWKDNVGPLPVPLDWYARD